MRQLRGRLKRVERAPLQLFRTAHQALGQRLRGANELHGAQVAGLFRELIEPAQGQAQQRPTEDS